MTSRTKTILIALVAFVLGGVGGGAAGAYVAINCISTFFGDGIMLGQVVNAQTSVAVLRHLRNGETDKAVEILETHLDGNIIGLRTDEKYAGRTNESVKKAISRAKDYRSQYPRKTNFPEVDAGVSDILNSSQNASTTHP